MDQVLNGLGAILAFLTVTLALESRGQLWSVLNFGLFPTILILFLQAHRSDKGKRMISDRDSDLAAEIRALAPDTVEHARGVLLSLQGSSDGFAFSAALDNYADAVRRSTGRDSVISELRERAKFYHEKVRSYQGKRPHVGEWHPTDDWSAFALALEEMADELSQ